MFELGTRMAVRLSSAAMALASRTMLRLAGSDRGSVLMEYAVMASGLGITVGGILAALGTDVTSLLQSVDFSICEHLALRSRCFEW